MQENDFTSLYCWLRDDPRTNEPKLARGEVPEQLKSLYERIMFSQVAYGSSGPFRITEDLLYFYELGFIHEDYVGNIWLLCKYLYPHRHMLEIDKWELLFMSIGKGYYGHALNIMSKHLSLKSTPPIQMSFVRAGMSSLGTPSNDKRKHAYVSELFATAVFHIPLRHKEIKPFCLLYDRCCPRMAFKAITQGRLEEMGDILSQITSAYYELFNGEEIDLQGTTSFTVLRNTLETLDEQLQEKKRIDNKEKYLDRIWNNEFVEIVKEAGWYIPTNLSELEKRGKDHHNCIGGYYSHFYPYNPDRTTRIVMNKENEAEIQVAHGKVTIIQCKTKYNKAGNTKGLSDICDWMSRNLDKISCTVVSEDTNNS